ncbi:MAG: cytochrome c-type biogenesis protein CcmH [Pseudomonadota bacterium]|nr:MAG: cytochrome c-type biogenesis protein CcmH [Pseudomonadota bacterium]
MLAAPAGAIVERQDVMPEDFTSEDQKQRFKDLIEELRCTVCQNQSLSDSNASLARDLRHKVRELMDEGLTDEEIKTFLAARYGDFVLYNPPLKRSTYMLWFGPFAFLLLGAAVVLVLVRRRRVSPADDGGLSEQEQQQLSRALGKQQDDKHSHHTNTD